MYLSNSLEMHWCAEQKSVANLSAKIRAGRSPGPESILHTFKLKFRAPKFVRHYLFNVNVEQLWCLFGGSSKQREVAGGSKYGSRETACVCLASTTIRYLIRKVFGCEVNIII